VRPGPLAEQRGTRAAVTLQIVFLGESPQATSPAEDGPSARPGLPGATRLRFEVEVPDRAPDLGALGDSLSALDRLLAEGPPGTRVRLLEVPDWGAPPISSRSGGGRAAGEIEVTSAPEGSEFRAERARAVLRELVARSAPPSPEALLEPPAPETPPRPDRPVIDLEDVLSFGRAAPRLATRLLPAPRPRLRDHRGFQGASVLLLLLALAGMAVTAGVLRPRKGHERAAAPAAALHVPEFPPLAAATARAAAACFAERGPRGTQPVSQRALPEAATAETTSADAAQRPHPATGRRAASPVRASRRSPASVLSAAALKWPDPAMAETLALPEPPVGSPLQPAPRQPVPAPAPAPAPERQTLPAQKIPSWARNDGRASLGQVPLAPLGSLVPGLTAAQSEK
jgi:hypothetical protein